MGLFSDTVENILKNNEIRENPGSEELRKLANETTSEYGSACFVTKVRSRSAKFTEVVDDVTEEHKKLLEEIQEHMKEKKLILMERTMGAHPEMQFKCRAIVPEKYARIPFMWQKLLFEPIEQQDIDTTVVFIPDWREIKILAEPEEGITFVLGSDYCGECKKGHLRMCTYKAKIEKKCLGLHAASKKIKVLENNELVEKGFVLFGLSGTGKTSLTIHNHNLQSPEGVDIIQDDFVILNDEGYCYGTENGFYLKTEGLDDSQKVLYRAAISSEAIFENVQLENGKIDFKNYELTSNGRGVIPRDAIKECGSSIDLERVDNVIFITRRNDVVPPVAKLTPEQAAAAFMLGESIETSAGDPTKAGQSIRVVGTNPFIIGDLHEEGHIFLNILKKNPDMQCFMLNTGAVGGEKITVNDSATILGEIARGKIEWEKDSHWSYEIPKEIEGVDKKKLNPLNYYSEKEYYELVDKLRKERDKWFEGFPELDKSIVGAFGAIEQKLGR